MWLATDLSPVPQLFFAAIYATVQQLRLTNHYANSQQQLLGEHIIEFVLKNINKY
jgi:hypothetical protein